MAKEQCKKCGKIRTIDTICASDGWHQPQCYHCGDPGYVEPFEDEPKGFFERVHEVEEIVQKANGEEECYNPECPKVGECGGECAKRFDEDDCTNTNTNLP